MNKGDVKKVQTAKRTIKIEKQALQRRAVLKINVEKSQKFDFS